MEDSDKPLLTESDNGFESVALNTESRVGSNTSSFLLGSTPPITVKIKRPGMTAINEEPEEDLAQ